MTTKYEVCRCDGCTTKRLVDAAPELLAALKNVVRFEAVSQGMNPSVWPLIHASIAKAEGRTDEE